MFSGATTSLSPGGLSHSKILTGERKINEMSDQVEADLKESFSFSLLPRSLSLFLSLAICAVVVLVVWVRVPDITPRSLMVGFAGSRPDGFSTTSSGGKVPLVSLGEPRVHYTQLDARVAPRYVRQTALLSSPRP